MSVEDRFADALLQLAATLPEVELLPVRLAKACVSVLPAAGAGLCALVHPELRLPIGASDEIAAYVERLQFTYAEGPCLRAYATGRPLVFSAAVIERLWPELHRDLTAVTPFRAVVSLPLRDGTTRIGALDLYLTKSTVLPPADLADALTIADLVAEALVAARIYTAAAQRADPFGSVSSIHLDPLVPRIQVWKAMGMLNVHWKLTTADALALLRAHAYATERLVDDVAHDVVTRRIPMSALRP